ncbi:hypothetical protein JDV02_001573 [Purpureocillium takamizusanense]|uniref:Uncharacterized protein n=1 Tax=Purpureocillium takamizusanense TaxID=2060973 RepID=A0A9Q8Q9F3_9HYPO|nr:uncharacterized protein JDV02_001573 [Purpureocillium takamizusanense]UNI14998.1 hypothetical protein JDV02_001573 [Purpureocillium takamizusanense]
MALKRNTDQSPSAASVGYVVRGDGVLAALPGRVAQMQFVEHKGHRYRKQSYTTQLSDVCSSWVLRPARVPPPPAATMMCRRRIATCHLTATTKAVMYKPPSRFLPKP